MSGAVSGDVEFEVDAVSERVQQADGVVGCVVDRPVHLFEAQVRVAGGVEYGCEDVADLGEVFQVPIGRWTLRAAILQAVRFAAERTDLTVSVNVSPRQILEADFVETVTTPLQETRLPADRLILEVTETLLVDASAQVVARMRHLADLGVGLALDDFGTGHSSLSRLRTLPFSRLKIDKSFIDDIVDEPDAFVMVDATVGLAHRLGMRVIAEGVETHEQLERLQTIGVDAVQGFLLGRPGTPDDLQNLVAASDDAARS